MKFVQQPFEALKITGNLPSPKGAALSIMRMCQQEDISVAQLAIAIKTDPALVGRLLKAANTVGCRAGRGVTSIEEALQVLGLVTVRVLVLSFSLVTHYRYGRCSGFDYDAFWHRSLVTALAFEALTVEVNGDHSGEVFCIGLLSQIGRLALATIYGERYAPLLSGIGFGEDARLCELECEAFALDHNQLTAALLLDWGFQEPLVESLYFSRRVGACSFSEDTRRHGLIRLILIADMIALASLASGADHSWRIERVFDLCRQMGLGDTVVQRILDTVTSQCQEWSELLTVNVVYPARFLPLGKLVEGGRVQLVIADHQEQQRLREILVKQNYEVLEQPDDALAPEKFLASVIEVMPDVLVVGLSVGNDEYQWLRYLREMRLGQELVIVIVVPKGDEDQKVAALEAGADVVVDAGAAPQSLMARLIAARRILKLKETAWQDKREISTFAADLAIANRQLHDIARTDVLTGFYNRRYAMELLQHEWDMSQRNDAALACMMIDLDHFKQINDRYGHDVGDRLLSRVAEAIRANLRVSDAPCRVGGDEFLVICPNTNAGNLRNCAERLLEAVRQVSLDTPLGEKVYASLSIGIATREQGMDSITGLLRAADEGMYLAKLAGRNTIGGDGS